MKADIPYEYRGGLRFFERAHIKDALSYLRIINNFADAAAWTRVLLHEEGLGAVAVSRIVNAVQQLENIGGLKSIGESLGEKARGGWNNFLKVFDGLTTVSKTPADMLGALLNSPYRDYLKSEHIDSDDRIEDIQQMGEFAKKYDSLENFLAETALHESFARGQVGAGVAPSAKKDEQIILSTIHQAKGLEWESVFVINVAAGSFPSDRSISEAEGLEEERRLFYVAITRAKKNLILTYPMEGGQWGGSMGGPSMFLEEIEEGLLEDHSYLSYSGVALDDPDEGITYESEDQPIKIKPGSFLRSLEDL